MDNVDTAGILTLNRIIQNSIGEFSERSYEVSHPVIPDSVLNYDRRLPENRNAIGKFVRDEPDCWPHPFDIVAINSIYQADYPQ